MSEQAAQTRALRILPDVRGLDVVDLGCGTGYWCAWLARLGARPTGLDVSEAQLETARALQCEHGVEFPLVHASAESVPLPDGSFDLAFSEYGPPTGATRTPGSPRRTGSCGPAARSSSCATRPS